MSMNYIRKHYGVPAKRGRRVIYNRQPGVITGSHGPYLRVRLDGDKRSFLFHPVWQMAYPDVPEKRFGESKA